MLKDALYGGINAAVLTAMNADLSIDLDRLAGHCRWLLANGCNGLAVLGTTGEANSLGINERISVLEGLVARGIPAPAMLPGTGTTAITDTVLLTRKAQELGCRGALLLPPFYYKNPSEEGLLAYFNEVIQRVAGDIKNICTIFPSNRRSHSRLILSAGCCGKTHTRLRGLRTAAAISRIACRMWRPSHAMGSRSMPGTIPC